MKNTVKKLVAILTVISVMFTAVPVAMADISVDVATAYYECASMYPGFVETLKAQPQKVTDAQIITFLESMQTYMLRQNDVISEDNFEDYLFDAVAYAGNLKKNINVRDAIISAYPGAVVDGAEGIISPEFEPLVETIKLILFGGEEDEPTTDRGEPDEEATEAPTEEKTEAPTEAKTEEATEKTTGKDEGGKTPSTSTTVGGGNYVDDGEIELPTEAVTEAPTRPADKTFSDINEAPWAEKAIYSLVDSGVINGYPDRTFKPNNPVTRAEFAKMITLASGRYAEKDKATYVSSFWDVPATAWEYPYVSAALKFGFITGRSATIFDPGSNITRADLCLIVYRYIKSINSEFKAKTNADGTAVAVTFADAALVPAWDVEAVNVLASHGIATARDTVNNKFEPTLSATRAECAVMIYEALKVALDIK